MVNGEEVAETLGLVKKVDSEQEAGRRQSRIQRRRAHKRQAEKDTKREIEEGIKTEDDVKGRRREEEWKRRTGWRRWWGELVMVMQLEGRSR